MRKSEESATATLAHAPDAPKFRVILPADLDGPDEPYVPFDVDAFQRWAKTGKGDPWHAGK